MRALLLSLFFLSSCSHIGDEKVADRKPLEQIFSSAAPMDAINWPVIRIDQGLSFSSPRRAPAAASTLEKLDITKLYFFSIYTQMQGLHVLTGEALPNFSCPRFHHHLLVHKDKVTESIENYRKIKKTPYALKSHDMESVLFPETFVFVEQKLNKLSYDQALTKMMVNLRDKHIAEVKELCEFGKNDSIYKALNLVDVFQTEAWQRNYTLQLKSYLKLSAFSHYYLMHSLLGRSLTSSQRFFNPFEEALVSRLKAATLVGYIDKVKELRAKIAPKKQVLSFK